MSAAPLERWEPYSDPIHRLVHHFDITALMVACHRWQPVLPPPPTPAPAGACEVPPDPAAHPPDIESAELATATADAAIALFARYGQAAADSEVNTATDLMIDFGQAYRRQPCPCQVCPDCGRRMKTHPCEYAVAVLYAPTRQALLRHLALAGHAVPVPIRMRGAKLAQLLRAHALPPDPHAALRQAVAEVVGGSRPPDGGATWSAADLGAWVDRLAGPTGTEARAVWTLRKVTESTAGSASPVGSGRTGQGVPGAKLTAARRAILTTLAGADKPLKGVTVARRAGYQPGSLRRHFVPLQTAGLIDHTTEGYRLTAAGRAVVTDLSRSCDRSHTGPIPTAGTEE